MGLKKCLKQKFCKKEDWREAHDDNQRKYREKFEIIDKFLLNYEDDRFIVYIDGENDIDWVEISDFKGFTDDERKQFYEAVAKLDRAQTYPCMLLKEEYSLSFKRILGAGYVAAFHKSFSTIDDTIEEAKNYVRNRNLEKARQIFLSWAGIITFLAALFLVWLHIDSSLLTLSKEVTSGIVFGVAGAYISIWMRYDDLLMKGFSTRFLLALEAISRLFVGAISAYVVYLAYRCQIVFNLLSSIDSIYVCSFLGFLGGLCERFVPSLVESFANKSLKENKEKE
ncbi:MAG: hypothetical protein J5644_00275 [Bacteroidales bacterium]|nr:hypothetical protein [Bacteroidales bacterium]